MVAWLNTSATNFTNSSEPGETSLGTSNRVRIVYHIFVGLLATVTVIANLVVIILLSSVRRSKFSIFNAYCVSLACTDLLVGACIVPLYLAKSLYKQWPLGIAECLVWQTLDFGVTTVSVLMLLAISYDRYRSVVSPLRHRTRISGKRRIVIPLVCWILGFSAWCPYIVYKQLFSGQISDILANGCNLISSGLETWDVAVIVIYVIPALALVSMYLCLMAILRKRFQLKPKTKDSTTHRSSSGDFTTGDVDQSNVPVTEIIVQRVRDQNIACYKKISLLVAVFVLCWLPYIVTWCIIALFGVSVSLDIHRIDTALAYGNSAISPVILIATSDRLRQRVMQFLCRLQSCNSRRPSVAEKDGSQSHLNHILHSSRYATRGSDTP